MRTRSAQFQRQTTLVFFQTISLKEPSSIHSDCKLQAPTLHEQPKYIPLMIEQSAFGIKADSSITTGIKQDLQFFYALGYDPIHPETIKCVEQYI